MKILKILFAILTISILTLTSCKETKSKSETTEEQVVDNEQTNEATIVVKANKALEYKFKINQYEKLEYEWKSDASLRYDFHGDPKDTDSYPKGYFESYANGTSSAAKGKITIPYDGSHGWYWKNTSTNDITIILSTKGNYNVIGVIQK